LDGEGSESRTDDLQVEVSDPRARLGHNLSVRTSHLWYRQRCRAAAAGGRCRRRRARRAHEVKAHLHMPPPSLESELCSYPRLFVGVASRLRTPDLVAIARAWHPDIPIREAGEYGAVIAAEHLGLPHTAVAFVAAERGMGDLRAGSRCTARPHSPALGPGARPGPDGTVWLPLLELLPSEL
jgi:hypothetical protein